jgi:hypothetical protein
MSYDWDGPREEVFDLYIRQNLSLVETSNKINKRKKVKEWKFKKVDQKGWRRGRGRAKVRRSAASSDDSSIGLPSTLADYRLNDEDGCSHRLTTEDAAHISSLKTTHKCWARHRTALSEVSENEGSEGLDLMETYDAELHSESESGSTISGGWAKIRASGLETSKSAERNEFSTQATVLLPDRSRRQVHKMFRVASVDSLLQGIQNEKSRHEGCGTQYEGPNDNLEYGKRVLEAWKAESEMGSSVE